MDRTRPQYLACNIHASEAKPLERFLDLTSIWSHSSWILDAQFFKFRFEFDNLFIISYLQSLLSNCLACEISFEINEALIVQPLCQVLYFIGRCTAQNMKFSIKDFFSNCDQICRKLRIWSHLLKKSLMENFIFSVVIYEI